MTDSNQKSQASSTAEPPEGHAADAGGTAKCPRCGQPRALGPSQTCAQCDEDLCWEAGGHAEQIHSLTNRADRAEALLREWFAWWDRDDDAPAKMPGALHIKTAVHFASLGELLPVSEGATSR